MPFTPTQTQSNNQKKGNHGSGKKGKRNKNIDKNCLFVGEWAVNNG